MPRPRRLIAPDTAERTWAGTDTPAGTGPGPGAPAAVTLSVSGPAKPGAVTLFDSQIGLAVRRWCPPVLGLPAHTGPDEYLDHRAALGHAEVSRRFLRAAGLAALCVDTGFEPEPLLSPPELAELAGAPAYEIVRLEQVAESVAAAGTSASGFAGAFREALADRARDAAGLKSVAAYRAGLDLPAARPTESGGGGGRGTLARPVRLSRRNTSAAGRPGAAQLPDLVRRRSRAAHPVPRRVRRPRRRPGARQSAAAGPAAARDRAHRAPVMLLHNYPYHREAG